MSNSTAAEVDLVGEETTLNIARAALFAALMGAFAYLSFPLPFSPVPVTLQTLGIFLAALFLGPFWGAAAMVLYLLAGALGAPVFSGGSAGLGVLLGPTGGYLFSYPIAALAAGAIAHGGFELKPLSDASVVRLVTAMVVATVIIYAIGVPVLWRVADTTIRTAVVSGALVFVPGGMVKIAAAVGIVRSDAIRAE